MRCAEENDRRTDAVAAVVRDGRASFARMCAPLCVLLCASLALLSPGPVAAVNDAPPPGETADAVSAATFDISDVRSLRFNETEDFYYERFRSRSQSTEPPRPGDFRVAFEEVGTDIAYRQSVGPLLEALERAFPERRVHLTSIPSRDFVREVTRERIPFVIATAGTMVSLMMAEGAVPLAVRENERDAPAGVKTEPVAGGLLIARADRADITDIASLSGKRVALESVVSFGPWQRLQGRLLDEGFDPNNFFSSVFWRPHDMPEVVNAVMHGHADAGLLSSCVFETLVEDGLIDSTALKTVGEYPSAPGSCRTSTVKFPDWTIGYMPSVGNDELRRFAAVVFGVPPSAGYRWGLRVDLSGVQNLMRALHYGPYEYLDEQTFLGTVKRYRNVLLAAAAVFLVLLLHWLRANHLVRIKTQALREALAARDRMEAEAKVTRERLSAIERVGLLSQMSSMFAHELKQPLASITNYIGGLKLWNKMRQTTPEDRAMAEEALAAAGDEARRAALIVERVRGYAKSQFSPLKPVDWTKALRRAAAIVEHHDTKRVPILFAAGEFFAVAEEDDRLAMVMGDTVELELLALNLIRNAGHAAYSQRSGFVNISLTREDGRLALRVTDNGPKLSEEAFARLTGYGESVKRDGLGIGLSICRGIVDRHGGTLRFLQQPTEGICAEVTIEGLERFEAQSEANGIKTIKDIEVGETHAREAAHAPKEES